MVADSHLHDAMACSCHLAVEEMRGEVVDSQVSFSVIQSEEGCSNECNTVLKEFVI